MNLSIKNCLHQFVFLFFVKPIISVLLLTMNSWRKKITLYILCLISISHKVCAEHTVLLTYTLVEVTKDVWISQACDHTFNRHFSVRQAVCSWCTELLFVEAQQLHPPSWLVTQYLGRVKAVQSVSVQTCSGEWDGGVQPSVICKLQTDHDGFCVCSPENNLENPTGKQGFQNKTFREKEPSGDKKKSH